MRRQVSQKLLPAIISAFVCESICQQTLSRIIIITSLWSRESAIETLNLLFTFLLAETSKSYLNDFKRWRESFFCRESFQGVCRKENEPSSYCLQFFWLMEKQKGKFLRYSRQVSSWWLVILFQRKMGKHQDTLVKIFEEISQKISPENFQLQSFPYAWKVETAEDNKRASQWKRFSFYHLIQQYFPRHWIWDSRWWCRGKKIQFSVKLECDGNKTTMFLRAILDSKNCHQPVFSSFLLNNYAEFII